MIVISNRRGCGCTGCLGIAFLFLVMMFLLSAGGAGVQSPVQNVRPSPTPSGTFRDVRPGSIRSGMVGRTSATAPKSANSSKSGQAEVASPAGLEPTLPAPEAGALSN